MSKQTQQGGFSLVEILVSLLVVSLAAANISGLQQMVIEQNRNNTVHVNVIELALEKMEEILQFDDIADLTALGGTEESVTKGYTTFSYEWLFSDVTSVAATAELTISWADVAGTQQRFSYSKQITLAMLLKGGGAGSADEFPNTIVNMLGSNKVSYFEPKMGYKMGAYVIYNSQLFEATSVHSVGGGSQRDVPVPTSAVGEDTGGWENLGRIDNPELATLFSG